jgi:hypothetical protein
MGAISLPAFSLCLLEFENSFIYLSFIFILERQ